MKKEEKKRKKRRRGSSVKQKCQRIAKQHTLSRKRRIFEQTKLLKLEAAAISKLVWTSVAAEAQQAGSKRASVSDVVACFNKEFQFSALLVLEAVELEAETSARD